MKQRIFGVLAVILMAVLAASSVFFSIHTAGSLKASPVQVSASEGARSAEAERDEDVDKTKDTTDIPQAYIDEMIEEGVLTEDDIKKAAAEEIEDGADPMYDGMFIYQIKWGDTLSELALKYHVRQDTLQRLNRIEDPDKIYADDYMIIPDMSAYTTD